MPGVDSPVCCNNSTLVQACELRRTHHGFTCFHSIGPSVPEWVTDVHSADPENEYKASGKGTIRLSPVSPSAWHRLLSLQPVAYPRCQPTQSTRKLGTTTTCRPSTWTLHLHLHHRWHRSRGRTPTPYVTFTERISLPSSQTTGLVGTPGHACLRNGYIVLVDLNSARWKCLHT